MNKLFSPVGIFFLLTLLQPGCSPKSGDVIVIGSKMDTEGAILGYIQFLALQDAGLNVEDRIETGPTLIVRQALLSGEVDGYIEYTGTALVNFMGIKDRRILSNADSAFKTIAKWDSAENNIEWLHPWSGINNTYTVLMQRRRAEAQQTMSISDLKNWVASGGKLLFGSDHEFSARADGLPGLLEWYGLAGLPTFRVINMDAGLVYQTLKQGSVDAVIGYSTDGRIAAFDLFGLTDDKHYFPVYNPTPVFRQQTLQRFPQIRKILNRIATAITAKDITAMNYRHDVKQERSKLLAREWIDKNLRILK
ncbi:MAG: glycine betaine ABC transporter substrate-binding protein [Calditrichia bacterium]